MFLRDFLYLEEAGKEKALLQDGLVDLYTLCTIGDTILMLTSFQLMPYSSATRHEEAQSLILEDLIYTPDEAYSLSLELEPKSPIS